MRAFDYLSSAHLVVVNRSNQDILRAPILFLIGFAIELTLKANLIYCGVSDSEIRKLKHDISKLWSRDESKVLHKRAKEITESFFSTFSEEKAHETLNVFIDDMDRLHSGKVRGYYPLRYQTNKDEGGPAPYLLISVFTQLAHEGIVRIMRDLDNEEVKPDNYMEFRSIILNSHYFKFENLEK